MAETLVQKSFDSSLPQPIDLIREAESETLGDNEQYKKIRGYAPWEVQLELKHSSDDKRGPVLAFACKIPEPVKPRPDKEVVEEIQSIATNALESNPVAPAAPAKDRMINDKLFSIPDEAIKEAEKTKEGDGLTGVAEESLIAISRTTT